ncbi:MAG: LPS export ABC transporter periplasmic protein LptC [Alphaproteobacteria bacterium]|nr:LPS export ABC transporter periplasmic protein LptC [Alphaproteobacteria bacterium]
MSSPTDINASRASRAVRFAIVAKFLSWFAAFVGLAVVVAFLVQAGLFSALAPREEIVRPKIDNPEQISASDSTVTGLDRQNQPYEVQARRGWQDEEKPNLVHMEELKATFHKPDGATYVLTSQTGLYDTKSRELDVTGDVEISEGDRFTARMDRAHIVVETKNLTSDVPVDVTMGSNVIRSNGLQITDDGSRILFLNGVTARFGAPAEEGNQTP